jgi:hypothetical protein
MTKFLHWRKMTWAIVFWSVAMIVWVIAGGAVVMSALLWSFVAVSLSLIWFMSRPLWSQGHGASLRRRRAPDTGPMRDYERVSTGH